MNSVIRQNTILVFTLSTFVACNSGGEQSRLSPEYDPKTGRLQILKYDSNGDGRIDMTSTMDGARVVKIELDKDFDGQPERWEYYDAQRRLEKVGFSRLDDGREDAWSYADPSGAVVRIEVSTRRDGTVQRIEHYEAGILTSAEEDTDADGTRDKWETYSGDRLQMVAFDSMHRGKPDRRLVYAADGSVRVEVDPEGDGTFVPENR